MGSGCWVQRLGSGCQPEGCVRPILAHKEGRSRPHFLGALVSWRAAHEARPGEAGQGLGDFKAMPVSKGIPPPPKCTRFCPKSRLCGLESLVPF